MSEHRRGRLSRAASGYAEVLTGDPRNADAWHLAGLVAFQQGAWDDAEHSIRTALQLRPGHPEFLCHLAATLLAASRPGDAESAARQGLKTDPRHTGCREKLASALSQQGKHNAGADVLQQLIEDTPGNASAHCNLGAMLVEAGQFDEAVTVLEVARHLTPDSMHVRLNLGAAFRETRQLTAALQELDRAVELGPDVPQCHVNRGNVRLDLGDAAGALTDFQHAVTLNPRSAVALNGLGRTLQVLGHWESALDALDLACRLDGPLSRYESNRLYCASLAPGLSQEQLVNLHLSWGREAEQHICVLPPVTYQHARIRIGYVSPDFRNHATMRFFLPMLEAHDLDRFDIYCYFEGREDGVSRRIENRCRGWRNTTGIADASLAAEIRRDEIDILVDLAGHTKGNRLPVFAARPAPVQVSFLGYPNTTGLSRIDYFLTDAVREPVDPQKNFAERVICLPYGACCFEAPPAPPLTNPPSAVTGRITLGSTHRLEKISPACLALWCRVLAGIPDARLLVVRDALASPDTRRLLKHRIESAGIEPARVTLRWELPANHLDVYADIDILLDVFPWGSGTTAYESMWMGVPVPTIRGGRGSCRATASLMHQCGFDELCAATENEYAELVTDLARNGTKLQELRRTLRATMTDTVCNASRFTRSLEAAYDQMLSGAVDLLPSDTSLPDHDSGGGT